MYRNCRAELQLNTFCEKWQNLMLVEGLVCVEIGIVFAVCLLGCCILKVSLLDTAGSM